MKQIYTEYRNSGKKCDDCYFIIAEKDSEKLAALLNEGGSCTSLGNLYTFDKKHYLLTISKEETGMILRQIRIEDEFSFMLAL